MAARVKLNSLLAPKPTDTDSGFPTPQPKQQEFLDSDADIAIYGGSAGSGKTLALLLDFAKPELLENPHYGGVIFRRTSPEITNEGGLWDEAGIWYPTLGATSNQKWLRWTFPTGASVRFAHLQHEKNIYNWQGAQVSRIAYDELTHFSKKMFFYLMTRMRSTHGIKPQLRATCNPDAESWLAELIDWWINPQGYPYPERSGVLRWFIVKSDEVIWADTAQDLRARYPNSNPKSFTFISAKLTDNPALLEKDPHYLANLEAQDVVERARLLDGNWRVKKSESRLFKAEAISASAHGEWSDPVFAKSYLFGIDPNFGGDDAFSCQVWDISDIPYQLVAEYKQSNASITSSINQCSKLVDKYTPVLVAVETNGGGRTVQERLIEHFPGVRIEAVTTTKNSKIINTDRIAIALEEGLIQFPPDWDGIDELRSFSSYSREAITGHDDSVMAWAVAFAYIEEARQLALINPLLLT